ncbi:MAG: nuclear transport factor 2 family protein [Magnetospirillum sp.]|nr:nuclear transport factor 2 family protein [Magnetospirillum sp.]
MLNPWADFWQDLTPDSVGRVRALCVPDIRFIDPFNDLMGVEALERLLTHMFATLEAPRFVVTDRAMGSQAGYLRWDFTACLRGRDVSLTGMSEVGFAPCGRVALHRDHWDAGAQVYGRVPVLGALVRLVSRRLALPPA